jgi:MinD-like ATPase involved in chromosome partitioning or flagellar assembly
MTRSIAIVSGKGGSGKTLVATALMLCFDGMLSNTILVDGDIGTGGLSYFLSVNYLSNVGQGLADYLLTNRFRDQAVVKDPLSNPDQLTPDSDLLPSFVKTIKETWGARCITVGNHRRFLRVEEDLYKKGIGNFIEQLCRRYVKDEALILIDCRGGIDEDSVAVCESVSDILVIVETDAAAIQSTLYLLDVLTDKELFHKVKGFVINKAFDDPTIFANTMANLFRVPHLGSVPFDFDTVRRFLHGELPEPASPLVINVGSVQPCEHFLN